MMVTMSGVYYYYYYYFYYRWMGGISFVRW